MLGQAQHHVATRRSATGLDEAQVTGGDLGLQGQVELGESALFAPLAQAFANRPLRNHGLGDGSEPRR